VVAVSAIASFYLLDRSAVPALAQAATVKPAMPMVSPVYNYLQENDLGVSGGLFEWSGYVLLNLMSILEDTGVQLGEAEYRAESEAVNAVYDLTYLITSADKKYLTALDQARLDRAAAERLFGEDRGRFEAMQQPIDDGLNLLHRLIAALPDNEVLVVHIG
jgi:hypothetical protein